MATIILIFSIALIFCNVVWWMVHREQKEAYACNMEFAKLQLKQADYYGTENHKQVIKYAAECEALKNELERRHEIADTWRDCAEAWSGYYHHDALMWFNDYTRLYDEITALQNRIALREKSTRTRSAKNSTPTTRSSSGKK